jgi:hypothetical protein
VGNHVLARREVSQKRENSLLKSTIQLSKKRAIIAAKSVFAADALINVRLIAVHIVKDELRV